MRQGAEAQKREEAQTEAVLKSVEQQAAEQYARDKASAAEELAAINGTWEPDEGTAYLYNKAQRYYYDKASSMYYGGDPPEWSAEPAILAAARYAAVPAAAASKPTSGEIPHRTVSVRSFCVTSCKSELTPQAQHQHRAYLMQHVVLRHKLLGAGVSVFGSPEYMTITCAAQVRHYLRVVLQLLGNNQPPRRRVRRDRRSALTSAAIRCP